MSEHDDRAPASRHYVSPLNSEQVAALHRGAAVAASALKAFGDGFRRFSEDTVARNAHRTPSPTRVRIDLNVRTHRNRTFTRLKNAHGPIVVGQAVEVFEEESGVYGPGVVTDIDHRKGLVYLAVDWAKLRDPDEVPDA